MFAVSFGVQFLDSNACVVVDLCSGTSLFLHVFCSRLARELNHYLNSTLGVHRCRLLVQVRLLSVFGHGFTAELRYRACVCDAARNDHCAAFARVDVETAFGSLAIGVCVFNTEATGPVWPFP